MQHADIVMLLAIGSTGMALLNGWQGFRPPPDLQSGGNPGKALLAIPIYSFMLIGAGFHFL